MLLLAAAILAAVLAAGCRTRPEQRAMFDSYQEEARRLEARIYDLEYDNMVLCDENERLKKRLEKQALGKPERADDGPRILPRSTPRAGGSTLPDEMEVSPPEIDLGPATPPAGTHKPAIPESEPALPDIDSPPGESSPPPPSDDPPDEPPPRPASILKLPASETLPAPKSSTKPKPELLPAPPEKKVSQLSFQWHSNGKGSSSEVKPAESRWTPRTARRQTQNW
jgi:outer membrane murein-binding lipoprotein Lpp